VEVRRRWPELARAVLVQGDPTLAAALTGTRVVAMEGDLITVEAPPRPNAAQTTALETALPPHLLTAFGTTMRVACVAARPEADDGSADLYRAAQSHPLVKDLMRRFEADIVSREIMDREEWLRRQERAP
jgi:hypothetical protein